MADALYSSRVVVVIEVGDQKLTQINMGMA